MRLGHVMASRPNVRTDIWNRSFSSLIRTNIEGLESPVLQLIHPVETAYLFTPYVEILREKGWEVFLDEETHPIYIWEQLGVAGAEKMLAHTNVTHIGFMADDFVHNPEWMQQLVLLINRHPTAKSCSIFRSAYKRHHAIIGGDGTDVLMSMHDATGSITRQEWIDYDAKNIQSFRVPDGVPYLYLGNSMDVHHAYARPGERWATSRDYWQIIAPHPGIEKEDCAIDFVGE